MATTAMGTVPTMVPSLWAHSGGLHDPWVVLGVHVCVEVGLYCNLAVCTP